MHHFSFVFGQREHRLIGQNAPTPEQMPSAPRGDSSSDSYRYMSPDEMRAVETARTERLAPLRAQEARSREEDLRQLPEIEKQMQMA